MRRVRAHQASGLGRQLTLLRAFLVASALILALGAVALSSRLSDELRAAALEDSARDTAAFSAAVLEPSLVRGNVVARPRSGRTLRVAPDMRGLNVYAQNGRLVFSTNHPQRVGRRRSSPDLRTALETNEASAKVVDPMGDTPRLVRVWVPLRGMRGTAVGAAEVALDESVITDTIADARWTIWYAVGIVFAALWIALAVLVSGASMRMRRQTHDLAAHSHDLLESSRELE